ncbi:hypothetical protein K1719_036412 [Acacia pycnantha]|nr:hypothetical protein K1719_036412 [Acacia pycnantha]
MRSLEQRSSGGFGGLFIIFNLLLLLILVFLASAASKKLEEICRRRFLYPFLEELIPINIDNDESDDEAEAQIPQDHRDAWFNEFLRHFSWLPNDWDDLRKAYNFKGSKWSLGMFLQN